MPADQLSQTFAALADPTRRAILARLALGECSVKELAQPFDMTLPAVSKHLKVLEKAGLIARGKEAQWRPRKLQAGAMKEADEWLEKYRQFWEDSLDRLDDYLHDLQQEQKKNLAKESAHETVSDFQELAVAQEKRVVNVCKTASQRLSRIAVTLALFLAIASSAVASEIGHFNGGFLNIRDYCLPPPGVYGTLYNYFYTTNRINDSSGDEVDDVTVTPGGGTPVTLDVDVDVDMFITAPGIIWVPDFTVLGARYGVLVSVPLANSSINAAVNTATGRGGGIDAGEFNVGDMLVQPLWLDWALKHWDFTFAWGVYIPTGKYDTENFDLPGGQTVEVEDPDNIGYGFWTNQFQSAIAWYPREDRSTAVTAALTFEKHSKKNDFDITPGNNLSLTYGVSQYLPLKKDHTLLLELGLAGYNQWQVSDDHGDDVTSDAHDQLHGIGAQAGITYVPWDLVVNSHYFYEYYAEDRFQGHAFGISFAKKFWGPKKSENAPPEDKQARRWAMKR